MRSAFIFVLSILLLFVLHFSFPEVYAASYHRTKFVDKKYIAVTMIDEKGNNIDVPSCLEASPDKKTCIAVDTAIGTISTDPAQFVQRIYSLVLGLAGGIALLLIIISGYKFMASRGNPEAVKAATEGLTSAIVGLLFIIFAFVILQIVGADILRIPGFNP